MFFRRAYAFAFCGSVFVLGVACGDRSDVSPTTTPANDASTGTVTPPSDGGAIPPPDSAPPAPPPASNTRLSVSGKEILGPDGKAIVLRGWNWGNWGTEQQEDAADNKAQGATIVRVPLRWWGDYTDGDDARNKDAPGHIDGDHLKVLDKEIDDITSQGLWVDLFFDSNCGQASTVHDTADVCGTGDDGKPANFGNAPAMKQELVELWSFLAEHYASHPLIAMYEILAEPNMGCSGHASCDDWTAIPKFYESIIPSIRAKDPLTPVLVGPGASYSMKNIATALLSPSISNVIYTGDILSGGSANPDSLEPAIQFRDSANVPIFVQQVGVKKSDLDAGASLDQTLTALNQASIGWTWWTYREPHNPAGQNFAPYYKATSATQWSVDTDWLNRIAAYFK